jgi:hypothetical protein
MAVPWGDIGGGFLAFHHGQFCEGWWHHTLIWWRHISSGMVGFWLSAIHNTITKNVAIVL